MSMMGKMSSSGYQQDLASQCVSSVCLLCLISSVIGLVAVVYVRVLVVSPLVSLMIDQVESLRKRGVSAAILSGNEGV